MRNQSTMTFEERERFAFCSNDPQHALLAELADGAGASADFSLAELVRENLGTLLDALRELQGNHEEGDEEYRVLDTMSSDLQRLANEP